ncbi:MAG: hypothetical protein EA411_04690 [Saprospirales bacterium]|nr:MAG: hypothetical protein EA411_04690 [Saprospirales bacterium]
MFTATIIAVHQTPTGSYNIAMSLAPILWVASYIAIELHENSTLKECNNNVAREINPSKFTTLKN